ncbi:TPM domain-containing protein [candidate division WWE3 bacterium]|uniref:TPM domain-containing protein n=1 Tax=candidate division WWE3 bacterium TaxID=2053526 RepID=A0A955LHD5_UNCKA|nr:TPM domain-containing protein [candidate division WWE3 bacterium]
MKLIRKLFWPFTLFLLLFSVTACSGGEPQSPDQIASVPFGEPDFPNYSGSWVIDTADVIDPSTEQEVDAILQQTHDEGYANTAIVVMRGVNEPINYITQLGRHLQLGETEGPRRDNGLIYLVVVDKPQDERVFFSIGTGLPELSNLDAFDVKDYAHQWANEGDWNETVRQIATRSDQYLREVYGDLDVSADEVGTVGDTAEGEDEITLTPEQQRVVFWVVVGIVVIWLAIFVILLAIGETDAAFEWLMLLVRIALMFLAGGGGGKKGSGSFGGRSG